MTEASEARGPGLSIRRGLSATGTGYPTVYLMAQGEGRELAPIK